MTNDRLVNEAKHVATEAKKAITGTGAAVATVAGEVLAAGVLHGTAQTVVQAVVAVLGVFGIGGGVYAVRNPVKRV